MTTYSADDIREIQMLLNGHLQTANLNVNGVWNRATEDALITFQISKGLPGSGEVDARTRMALRSARDPAPVTRLGRVEGTVGGIVLTRADVLAVCPNGKNDLVSEIIGNVALLYQAGITKQLHLAHFLGQLAATTDGLYTAGGYSPEALLKSTLAFWRSHSLSHLAEADNVLAMCKIIRGGDELRLEQATEYTRSAKRALGIADD